MTTAVKRHLFDVDEYHWMGRVGILCEDARVELIEGDIIDMSPIGDRHMWCVTKLSNLLVMLLATRCFVSVQNPVRLSNRSEPQPDIALLRLEAGRRLAIPSALDVLLLIEVSDSTLEYDQGTKLRLYAQAGIAEVWIVNLEQDQVEVYREPAGDGYALLSVHERDGIVSPLAFPDITIRCEEILP